MIEAGSLSTSPNRRFGLRSILELGSKVLDFALPRETSDALLRIRNLDFRPDQRITVVGETLLQYESANGTASNQLRQHDGATAGQLPIPGFARAHHTEQVSVEARSLGRNANPNELQV